MARYIGGDRDEDVALVRLVRPIQGVDPIALSAALASTGTGTFVGYGRRGGGQSGQRYSASVAYAVADSRVVRTNNTQLCGGDSGGPLLDNSGDRPQIAALLSRGSNGDSDNCGGPNILMRADTALRWVNQWQPTLAGLADALELAMGGSVELDAGQTGTATLQLSSRPTSVSALVMSSSDVTVELEGRQHCSDSGQAAACSVDANAGEQVRFRVRGANPNRTFYQVFVQPGALAPAPASAGRGSGGGSQSGGCAVGIGSVGGGVAYGWLALLCVSALLRRGRRRAQ
jgi:hypothetical protein